MGWRCFICRGLRCCQICFYVLQRDRGVHTALPAARGVVIRGVRVRVEDDFEKNFAVSPCVFRVKGEIGAATRGVAFAPKDTFTLNLGPAVRRCCVIPRLIHAVRCGRTRFGV